MNISEATKKSMETGKWMHRTSDTLPAIIKPTNYGPCCIICPTATKNAEPLWNPKAEDLIAEDWELTNITPENIPRELHLSQKLQSSPQATTPDKQKGSIKMSEDNGVFVIAKETTKCSDVEFYNILHKEILPLVQKALHSLYIEYCYPYYLENSKAYKEILEMDAEMMKDTINNFIKRQMEVYKDKFADISVHQKSYLDLLEPRKNSDSKSIN